MMHKEQPNKVWVTIGLRIALIIAIQMQFPAEDLCINEVTLIFVYWIFFACALIAMGTIRAFFNNKLEYEVLKGFLAMAYGILSIIGAVLAHAGKESVKAKYTNPIKMVSIALSCVKYLLFFFSLLFAITGVAILVVGALLQSVYHNYSSFINENFIFLPIIIIVAGAVIFIIAFFGCCGTVKENLCMISTFASLLLTVFIMEIVAAVGGFIFHNDLKDIITRKMTSSLDHYETDVDVARSWTILQTDLHCCGVNGPADWKEKIPLSCCQDNPTNEQCTEGNAYKDGCLETMYSFLEKNSMIIIIVAAVVALIQLVGVGFACCLAHSIHKGYESV